MQGRQNICYGFIVTMVAPGAACSSSSSFLKAWLRGWSTSGAGSSSVFPVPSHMVSAGRHSAVYCIPDSAMGTVSRGVAPFVGPRQAAIRTKSLMLDTVRAAGARPSFSVRPWENRALFSSGRALAAQLPSHPKKGNAAYNVSYGLMDLMAASETILKKEWQES